MTSHHIISDKNALLIYKVGPVHCCSPALNIETIILPPVLHHTPGSQDFAGVFHHVRGMVSVVDLRQRFGVDETDRVSPGRIVIAEVSGGLAGFWVDDVGDVCPWPQQGWSQTPPLVPRTIFKRTLLHKQHIHLYADFDDLFKCRESGYLRQHIQTLKEKAGAVEQATTLSTTSAHHPAATSPVTPGAASPVTSTPAPAIVTHTSHTLSTSKKIEIPKRVPRATGTTTFAQRMPTPAKSGKISQPAPVQAFTDNQIPAGAHTSIPDEKTTHTTQDRTEPAIHSSAHTPTLNTTTGFVSAAALIGLCVVLYQLLTPATAPQPVRQIATPAKSEIAAPETSATATDYQAQIDRDSEGITITLQAPSEEMLTTEIQAAAPVDHTITSTVPNETQIVHTVVKGDTLWDIASQYVNNPWRYPELAKLSKISNPHRIYPGDKVKIIIQRK
jgi:chemotaxis signal transduction protein/LysM repeat protein